MWGGLGKSALYSFHHSDSPRKEFLLLNLVTHISDFQFSGEGGKECGWFCSGLREFLLLPLSNDSERW